MNLETKHLYHIYNQGNNGQRIFFTRDNYLYFLKKVREFMLPYTDVIAWCLMPNHFHLLVYVREVDLEVVKSSEGFTRSEALTSEAVTKTRTLNDSIGLLLRSYTRAINKQEKRSGSLFRNPTKAECTTKSDGITPSYFNTSQGTRMNVRIPEEEYPQVCWNYIHDNPVAANLVKLPEEWEFSSCRDYRGLRNGKMINRKRAEEFVNTVVSK